jgi:hypothetical protein
MVAQKYGGSGQRRRKKFIKKNIMEGGGEKNLLKKLWRRSCLHKVFVHILLLT